MKNIADKLNIQIFHASRLLNISISSKSSLSPQNPLGKIEEFQELQEQSRTWRLMLS